MGLEDASSLARGTLVFDNPDWLEAIATATRKTPKAMKPKDIILKEMPRRAARGAK